MIDKNELKPKQLIAIALLAQGNSMVEAAIESNVCEKTIRRWLQQREFKSELRRVVSVEYSQELRELRSLISKGTSRLKEALDDDSIENIDTVRIVNLILSAADRYENLKLDERLSAIEERLNA